MAELTEKVSLQPSTIYAMVQAGDFPAPFKIAPGGRASGWLLGDVEGWLVGQRCNTSTLLGTVKPGVDSDSAQIVVVMENTNKI